MTGIELFKKSISTAMHHAWPKTHKEHVADIPHAMEKPYFQFLCDKNGGDHEKSMNQFHYLVKHITKVTTEESRRSFKLNSLNMTLCQLSRHLFTQESTSGSNLKVEHLTAALDQMEDNPSQPIIGVIGQLIIEKKISSKEGAVLLEQLIHHIEKNEWIESPDISFIHSRFIESVALSEPELLRPFSEAYVGYYDEMASSEGMSRSNGEDQGRMYQRISDAFEKLNHQTLAEKNVYNIKNNRTIPDNEKVLSSPTGEFFLFKDGSTATVNRENHTVSTSFMHEDVMKVDLGSEKDNASLIISINRNKNNNTLPHTLELIKDGMSVTRMPNPHDTIDDIFINNESDTTKLDKELLKCDPVLITSQLGPVEAPQKKRVFSPGLSNVG